MMRILLDARSITEQPAGVARYALDLIPAMVELAPEHDWCVLRHASNTLPIPGVREVFVDCPIDTLENVFFGHRAVEEAARQLGTPDVFHSLFHILPAKLPAELRTIVTLHDLVWIEHADISQPSWLKARAIEKFATFAIPRALRRADHVISVSAFTQERSAKYHDSPSSVVMHGVESRFFEAVPPPDVIVDFLTDEGCRYLVAVGNSKPYKNLGRLIQAYARVKKHLGKSKLVLIGNTKDLKPLVHELGLTDQDVVMTGFLDDEDLRRIVGHAHLFVFPSLVEGFGLPPLEAMALGVPVITSDLEPMKTVGGSAAIAVDPLDISVIADAILRVFSDAELHAGMRELGRAWARKNTWRAAAEKTLLVY